MNSSPCPFCSLPVERIVLENDLALAILDGFPVTEGHALVIPKRHVEDYFGLTREELSACDELLRLLRRDANARDGTVQGFNIGVNVGAVAGQTVFHCHIHLIPRRSGDVSNPRGGIRHLIPGKGFY